MISFSLPYSFVVSVFVSIFCACFSAHLMAVFIQQQQNEQKKKIIQVHHDFCFKEKKNWNSLCFHEILCGNFGEGLFLAATHISTQRILCPHSACVHDASLYFILFFISFLRIGCFNVVSFLFFFVFDIDFSIQSRVSLSLSVCVSVRLQVQRPNAFTILYLCIIHVGCHAIRKK